jgi:membrane-associated phospholipid phosphatase
MSLLLLWRRQPRARVPLVLYNFGMVFVLVYGSEHYVSDILMGWVYAAVVYVVVTRFIERRSRRGGRPMASDG